MPPNQLSDPAVWSCIMSCDWAGEGVACSPLIACPHTRLQGSHFAMQGSSMEMDLCELLLSMKLDQPMKQESTREPSSLPLAADNDESMSEAYLPNNTLICTAPSPPCEPSYQGCAYLQSIQSQLDSFPTTGGEYIESIFTHRQIFFAYPGGHRCCARAFSDLACSLQRREWRADREADMEAVTAFHYEAQFIASVVSC
ncbi:hypothetical protein C8R43DRAFT_982173 [Mycena crocata]|nr:hypothetical protein C8R43DRAFT_982173 [Mycena crocata]